MNPWKAFFDACAPRYGEHAFTHNTLAEVDFVVSELCLSTGDRVLDVGCGTGRRAVELARRGFRVTGIDISPGMLAEAARSGAGVGWVCCDATRSYAQGRFDAAICLCEGAFCLFAEGEDPAAHDLAILRTIHLALRPGGGLLLNALSGHGAPGPEIAPGCRENLYLPGDLRALVERAGFEVCHLGGGTAGRWGHRPVDEDDVEMMAVCRKMGA